MASASVSKRTSAATGPKISSRTISMSGRHVADDGGAIEQGPGFIERAADEDFRALLDGVADQRLDLGDRFAVDQRADRWCPAPCPADVKLLDRLDQRRGEAVVDAGLHENAVGADAGLAGVAVLRGHGAGDRLVEIGVVEDDQRRVAAELERQLLHRVGALAIEDLADLGRAGEGQLAHASIVAEHLADGRRVRAWSRC